MISSITASAPIVRSEVTNRVLQKDTERQLKHLKKLLSGKENFISGKTDTNKNSIT